MYRYIYIYIERERYVAISLSLYIYIYIYIYRSTYLYIYPYVRIYICIYTLHKSERNPWSPPRWRAPGSSAGCPQEVVQFNSISHHIIHVYV